MSYTVQQLAKLAGVSVRTLHHYDELGLLSPAYYGENGYRYYEEPQLLRLQQILFFRELGFPLKRIGEIVGRGEFDQQAALAAHRKVLQKEVSRLRKLIRTIDQTMNHIQGKKTMQHGEMYHGFSAKQQAEYEEYLVDRYGPEIEKTITESKQRVKGWTKQQYGEAQAAGEEINTRLVQLIERGASADSEEVQEVVDMHYQWIQQFWQPDAESYPQLGELYCDHEGFREYFAKYHQDLAQFLAKAMRIYAMTRLS